MILERKIKLKPRNFEEKELERLDKILDVV